MGRTKKKARQLARVPDPKKWPPTFRLGWFSALSIRLQEAAINDVVLRVPLRPKQYRSKFGKAKKRLITATDQSKSVKPDTKLIDTTKACVALKRHTDPSTVKSTVDTKPPVKNSTKSEVKNGHRHTQVQPRLRKTNLRKNRKSAGGNSKNSVHLYPRSKLTIDFMKLSELVCVMKLPSPRWKVTVAMNSDLTTAFKFTDDDAPKSVVFSQINPQCNITMQGIPVILLGCPKSIDCLRDVEILLDIVNTLDLWDCMVDKM